MRTKTISYQTLERTNLLERETQNKLIYQNYDSVKLRGLRS